MVTPAHFFSKWVLLALSEYFITLKLLTPKGSQFFYFKNMMTLCLVISWVKCWTCFLSARKCIVLWFILYSMSQPGFECLWEVSNSCYILFDSQGYYKLFPLSYLSCIFLACQNKCQWTLSLAIQAFHLIYGTYNNCPIIKRHMPNYKEAFGASAEILVWKLLCKYNIVICCYDRKKVLLAEETKCSVLCTLVI